MFQPSRAYLASLSVSFYEDWNSIQVTFTAFIPMREICNELIAVESTKINIVISNAISGLQAVILYVLWTFVPQVWRLPCVFQYSSKNRSNLRALYIVVWGFPVQTKIHLQHQKFFSTFCKKALDTVVVWLWPNARHPWKLLVHPPLPQLGKGGKMKKRVNKGLMSEVRTGGNISRAKLAQL